ncbi:MAG: hypothetical protein AB7I08_08655 [Thermoleophilia bacterium]
MADNDDPQPGAPPPPPPDGSAPSGRNNTPWIIAAVAGGVVVALAVVLAVVLLGGGDEDAEASGGPQAAARAEYAASVKAPVARLTASAEATGAVLGRTSDAGDLARVGRMANQQLKVVQRARARIAETPSTPGSRKLAGTLLRATQQHRAYLTSLVRITDLPGAEAKSRMARVVKDGRRVVVSYRQVARQSPGLTTRITTAGLADVSGLRQAVNAKAAAEAAAATPSGGGGGGGGGGSSSGTTTDGRLAVTSVSASDLGGTISISANYCDRTPGTVNDFIYTFRLERGGEVYAQDSYPASQTRACNGIGWDFSDTFPVGYYTARVIVSNLTNGVEASSSTGVDIR